MKKVRVGCFSASAMHASKFRMIPNTKTFTFVRHMKSKSEIIIYQADELTKVEVQIDNETVWLSQEQMASLFGRNRVAITQHIGNIFKEGELIKEVVCKDFLLTTQQGAIQGKTDLSRNYSGPKVLKPPKFTRMYPKRSREKLSLRLTVLTRFYKRYTYTNRSEIAKKIIMEKVRLNVSDYQSKSLATRIKAFHFAKILNGFTTLQTKEAARMPIADRHSSTLFYQSFPRRSF